MSPFTNGGGVLAESARSTEAQHMLFLNNDVCVKCKVHRHMVETIFRIISAVHFYRLPRKTEACGKTSLRTLNMVSKFLHYCK